MELIIETSTNRVKYAYPDSYIVAIGSAMTTIVDEFGKPITIIADMNTGTAYTVTGDLPEGETLDTFVGDKYLLSSGVWSNNPDYIAPTSSEE